MIDSNSDDESCSMPDLLVRKPSNESESEDSDIESENENTVLNEIKLNTKLTHKFRRLKKKRRNLNLLAKKSKTSHAVRIF